MERYIIAVFRSRQQAREARQELLDAGMLAEDVEIDDPHEHGEQHRTRGVLLSIRVDNAVDVDAVLDRFDVATRRQIDRRTVAERPLDVAAESPSGDVAAALAMEPATERSGMAPPDIQPRDEIREGEGDIEGFDRTNEPRDVQHQIGAEGTTGEDRPDERGRTVQTIVTAERAAQEFGRQIALDDRYANHAFEEIEPQARLEFEGRNLGQWDRQRDTIRRVYEQFRAAA